MFSTVASFIYVLVCFLLLTVVLLQQGKGGGMAAAFGGASSQTAFGARSGATMMTRATAVLGALFMIGAFFLTVMGRSGPSGSVVSGVDTPGEAQPVVPALPTAPLPTGPGTGTGTPPTTTQGPPPTGGSGSD